MAAWSGRGHRLDAAQRDPRRPNVLVILADDIGYGDLGCYGATQVRTPNLDRLASQGRRFTDAHSPSCGLHSHPGRPVDGPIFLAAAGRIRHFERRGAAVHCNLTAHAARDLQAGGYATAAVGKWHLGLGGDGRDGTEKCKTDYNARIQPGPLEIGFDYFFGVPATGDRIPCVYVENHGVVGYDPAIRSRSVMGCRLAMSQRARIIPSC